MEATGKFTLKMTPQPARDSAPGMASFLLEKVFEGDIVGTALGEMTSAGDPSKGGAGYVAMERITGTLGGKTGSFVLQHSATMNAGAFDLRIVVAPGSGDGELAGITGTFALNPKDHSFVLTYDLG